MWAKMVREKEWISEFGQCGAISQVAREQLTKHQVTMKFTNAPNPNNTMNIP